jgi:hypothetical protein
LILDGVVLVLMIWMACGEAGNFKEIYGSLAGIRYRVMREGAMIVVKWWELLVGDVVCGGESES